MPYKKNYRRRFRRYKTRSKQRQWGKYGYSNLAQTALKTAQWVAGLVNAEAKDYYVTQTTINPNNNGQIVSLNSGIVQGTGDSQRTGDSIKMKTLTIRGQLQAQSNLPGAAELVRIIIFLDKQNEITTGAELLNIIGSNLSVLSPKDDDKYYQTSFLYDRTFNMSLNQYPQKIFKKIIKLNTHVKYNNTNNDIENGALKLFYVTQQPVTTGATHLQFSSKLTFMDN